MLLPFVVAIIYVFGGQSNQTVCGHTAMAFVRIRAHTRRHTGTTTQRVARMCRARCREAFCVACACARARVSLVGGSLRCCFCARALAATTATTTATRHRGHTGRRLHLPHLVVLVRVVRVHREHIRTHKTYIIAVWRRRRQANKPVHVSVATAAGPPFHACARCLLSVLAGKGKTGELKTE